VKVHEYTVILHKAEEGGYWLEVPALEGCYTQGETVEETLKNGREAIALCLDVMKDMRRRIPKDGTHLLGKVVVAR
jgi:predicted RNase H-like HicB family nuclease